MNLYAESSAVLAWLFGEDRGDEARALLSSAQLVLTSDLTLIECDRVLHRTALLGNMSEVDAARVRVHAGTAAEHWVVFSIEGEVVERARRAFPREPIRTLDAIHLATALAARASVTDLHILSLDERIRGNAFGLGFDVVPPG